ncbi:MAG: imidazolonepropionase [Acidimicrobiia bacterium]
MTDADASGSTNSLVLSGIGELVTNDPERSGLLGLVHDAAVAVVDGRIEWVGASTDLPAAYSGVRSLDLEGRAVLPGFVDAHTHTVFAGDRANEFSKRMAGAGYAELLAAGGGIYSTVGATREASFVDLIGESMPRLQRMFGAGTTTVEVKTGYGLDVESETKMVAAGRALDMALPIDVISTLLGGHVVAPEFSGDRGAYVDLVAGPMLDSLAGEVSFVDVFCDGAAFGIEETRTIASAAAAKGLPIRLHADQLSRTGGAALAAELGAASADHLDHATDNDLEALADAGTVAVLLPGVSYAMREPAPDGRRFWDSGVEVAIATDCNPGTSYIETMQFVISLAVVESNLTAGEAVWAATAGGARSLLLDDRGAVVPGMVGDLVAIGAPSHEHLAYRPDGDLVDLVVKSGQPYGDIR